MNVYKNKLLFTEKNLLDWNKAHAYMSRGILELSFI